MSGSKALQNILPALQHQPIRFSFNQLPWQGQVIAVQQVSTCDLPTGIPYVPVYIRGSIRLANWVAPVLDMHQYCGLSPQSLQTTNVAIVQFSDTDQDSLMREITQNLTQDHAPPSPDEVEKNAVSVAIFTGIAVIDGQLVILMDADQLIRKNLLKQSQAQQQSSTA